MNIPDKITIPLRHGGRVEITQSALRVVGAVVTHDYPDCVIVSLDVNAKYGEAIGATGGEKPQRTTAWIGVGKETIGAAEREHEATGVTITGKRAGDWRAIVDGGRYAWRVVFYRHRRGGRGDGFETVPPAKPPRKAGRSGKGL